jgi:hypothetical protein
VGNTSISLTKGTGGDARVLRFPEHMGKGDAGVAVFILFDEHDRRLHRRRPDPARRLIATSIAEPAPCLIAQGERRFPRQPSRHLATPCPKCVAEGKGQGKGRWKPFLRSSAMTA